MSKITKQQLTELRASVTGTNNVTIISLLDYIDMLLEEIDVLKSHPKGKSDEPILDGKVWTAEDIPPLRVTSRL